MTETLIAGLAAATDEAAVIAAANAHVRKWGVKAVMVTNLSQGSHPARGWTPVYSDFPAEFEEEYRTGDRRFSDPMMRAALKSLSPIRARDVLSRQKDCRGIKRFAEIAAAHGLVDGLGMTVVSRPGSFNYVGLAFDRLLHDLDPVDMRFMHREVELIGRVWSTFHLSTSAPLLSRRETAVLHYLAQGKAHKEIARALDVAPSTVDTLVLRGFKKLGVTSKAAAVAEAARRGVLFEA